MEVKLNTNNIADGLELIEATLLKNVSGGTDDSCNIVIITGKRIDPFSDEYCGA